MNIFRLSLSKLISQPLNPAVTVLLFAIGIGMISLVISTEKLLKEQFSRNLASIDLVVGAKGSPLQLIMSTVFHIDTPTGNISLNEANQIGRNPMVEKTIPIALGDNYRGFRIVGTTTEYGGLYNASLNTGSWFKQAFEAVVGAEVASATGLSPGDQFTGRHGFTDHGHHHDEDIYTVKGILQPSGTVLDRLILTTVDTYWHIHSNHFHPDDTDPENSSQDNHQHGEDCDHGDKNHIHGENCDHTHEGEEWRALVEKMDAREDISADEMALFRERSGQTKEQLADPTAQITALLVFYSTPRAAIQLPRFINDNSTMQAASPAFETHRLFSLVGTAIKALQWLAWVIIFVSAINLLIQLTSMLNQSISEIALIRALGTGKFKVMLLLILQGLWVALSGWALGILISKMVFVFFIRDVIQFSGSFSVLQQTDLVLFIFSVSAGFLASIWPAIRAYRSDIHHILNKG